MNAVPQILGSPDNSLSGSRSAAKRQEAAPKILRIKQKLSSCLLATGFALVFTFTTQAAPSTNGKPGTITVDGIERTYAIHEPPTPWAVPRPLLIMLHGAGGSGPKFENVGMDKVADQNGFVVVYPSGTVVGQSGKPSWDSRLNGDPLTLHFLRALITSLEPKYAIDSKRVYVAGMSAGALMTCRAAVEMSDILAGCASVCGGLGWSMKDGEPPPPPALKRPVSLLMLSGQSDDMVPPAGKQTDRARLWPAEKTIAWFVKEDGCDPKPKVTTMGPNSRTEYTGPNGVRVTYYSLVGGHSWQNGGPEFATNQMIWDFFKSLPSK